MNEIPMSREIPSLTAINPTAPTSQPLPTTRLICPKCGYGKDNPDEHINQRPPVSNDPKGECECPSCHFRWQTDIKRTDDKLPVLTNSITEEFKMLIFKSPSALLTLRQQPKFTRKLDEILETITEASRPALMTAVALAYFLL
jgi:hypothetical protein